LGERWGGERVIEKYRGGRETDKVDKGEGERDMK
jgi:hypothetical protein